MKNIQQMVTIALAMGGLLLPANIQAAEYPPALNYDDFAEAVSLGNETGTLHFGSKILSVHMYLPGRDADVRTDLVDAQGKVLSAKEFWHQYKNGNALGQINSSVFDCKTRPESKCITGPSKINLTPGLYWLVYSEKGKVFSAEWFEVKSYPLGEGRFAKGQRFYTVLPQDNMAKLYFTNNGSGDLMVDVGLSAGPEAGDKSAVTKKLSLSLKHNGKAFGKSVGNVPQQVNIYPSTTLLSNQLVKVQGNSGIKPQDLKDGKYELDVNLDGKSVRRFQFEVKGGKIVYQGRQQESTQPPERMVVAEKSYWLWNTYAKEPSHSLPSIDFSAAVPAS